MKAIGLALPDVHEATRYDGASVLQVGGAFMAGPATHPSAEPGTLAVRIDFEARAWLLDEAPECYYLTPYYQPHPVVLVRLAAVGDDALRDLLAAARRVTLPKSRAHTRRAAADRRVR